MAAAILNKTTLLSELKNLINDNDNHWQSDAWYKSKIFEHFITNQQSTWTFTSRADGVWTIRNDGRKIWFYGLTFTGEDEATYSVYPTGSVELTDGTDSNTNLTLTATQVNFPELVVDVCQYLITHKAQEDAASIGATSFTPQDESRLIVIMEIWRGFVAI